MRVNGVELECREIAGAEPALVFLHEGLGSVGLWRDFPERLDPRLPGLRQGTELVLRDERWHVGFGTRCLIDAGLDETAILAEGEAAAAVWAPEHAERVVTTLRRRLAMVRSERVTLH